MCSKGQLVARKCMKLKDILIGRWAFFCDRERKNRCKMLNIKGKCNKSPIGRIAVNAKKNCARLAAAAYVLAKGHSRT